MHIKNYLLLTLFGLMSHINLFSQAINPYCISGRFAENDLFNQLALMSKYDVVYGSNLNYNVGFDTLKLNIFYVNPLIDNLPKRPLVVLIHGGDFVSGDKSEMNNYAEQLAKKGYVAATIDYRLGWTNSVGGDVCNGNISTLKYAMYRALQDANASIRFLVSNAQDYAIDTNYIFLLGQDAGAITAMQVGFANQNEANILMPGSFADLGGIFNSSNQIQTTFSLKGIVNWCGAVLDTNLINANENIPVLSLHGVKDSIYPIDIAPYRYCTNATNPYPLFYGPKTIYTRMKNLGICTQANYDVSGTHCNFPTLESVNYLPFKFTCFFKNILCSNCITEEKNSYNIQSCMDAAPLITNEILLVNQLSIFPNPAESELTIEGILTENSTLTVTVYAALGQVIYDDKSSTITAGKMSYRLMLPNGISSGIYFIKVKVGEQEFWKKIQVQ